MINIGVSASHLYPDENRDIFKKKTLCYIEKDMAEYLTIEGVLPTVIPSLSTTKLLPLLEQMDGFILQGGVDISPKTYGEDYLDEKRWPGDMLQDRHDLTILDYAFQQAKPVFGICRGFQLINVYFGGCLYQDITTQKKTDLVHRDPQVYDSNYHEVKFVPGGLLGSLYKNNVPFRVNSVHHQGIKELAKDLTVEAISPQDNLIEAFIYTKLKERFILGVQWHPEFSPTLGKQLISPQPLFDLFLQAIQQRQS